MGSFYDEPQREDEEAYAANESQEVDFPCDTTERSLLETVLSETMAESDQVAFDLVFSTARASHYSDTSQLGAVKEFVHAVLARRFPGRDFSSRLVTRIAYSLVDTPEATVRLERLWQEARAGE